MMEERWMGILPNLSKRKGLFGMQAFNLLLTERRMIPAEMTKEMLKDEARRTAAEATGAGAVNRVMATMNSGIHLYKRYETMDPVAALAENPGNFALERAQLQSIRVKGGGTDEEGRPEPAEITIRWNGGKVVW
ncbi:MAG: hypothetical protein JXQ27_06565 [Acidobacteria bacterium]|nr:hypothetical protein [Acidobacteriota bacterium]